MFPFEGFFHPGKQTKGCSGGDWVNREGGAWGMFMLISVKSCWTLSVVWAGALINHPSWNRQMCWKSLKKISLKLNATSHNNTSWHTDRDGFLEHSPSGGSLYYKEPTLQKTILGFLGPPSYIWTYIYEGSGYQFCSVSPKTNLLSIFYIVFLIFPLRPKETSVLHPGSLALTTEERRLNEIEV